MKTFILSALIVNAYLFYVVLWASYVWFREDLAESEQRWKGDKG